MGKTVMDLQKETVENKFYAKLDELRNMFYSERLDHLYQQDRTKEVLKQNAILETKINQEKENGKMEHVFDSGYETDSFTSQVIADLKEKVNDLKLENEKLRDDIGHALIAARKKK